MFLNEVINKVASVVVFELLAGNTGFFEEDQQIGIDILQVEASVRIPTDVLNVLEISGRTNVLLR